MFNYYNFTDKPVTLEVGERIGQGVILSFERAVNAVMIDALRGEGGFGSTGK